MCSVSQDDIQEHYDGPGGDTTFILSDTNAWEPDQLSLNPSKEPENSIVTSIPSTAPFNDQYTWAEDENNEGEDAGRDELYNVGDSKVVLDTLELWRMNHEPISQKLDDRTN